MRFRFVYPSYHANTVEQPPEGPPIKVRAKYAIPEGGIGHIWDNLARAFLCNDKLTKADIASSSDCKRTMTRDYAPAGHQLCPQCQDLYIQSDDPTAVRYRDWLAKRPTSVKSSAWRAK